MDPNLYQAASQLPPGDHRIAQLQALAVSPGSTKALESHMRTGLLWVAALLLGGGLIFWVAANWQEQSRLFRLGLVQSALAVAVLVACLWPRVRWAALFCATLVLGGLLALVGQTYQTGADAWQLFAVWAALSLIWVGMARSDWLWLLWVLIVATGIAMWTGRFALTDVLVDSTGGAFPMLRDMGLWLLLAMVPALVSLWPALRVKGGMGWWSHRAALGCALVGWVMMGLMELFEHLQRLGPAWMLALVLTAASLWVSLRGRFQDFAALCLAALAINALLLAPLARFLLMHGALEAMLLIGVLEMVALGLSLRWLMGQHQRMLAEAARQEVLK